MSLKEAKEEAKRLGYSIRKTTGGDYRVNKIGGAEVMAVYEATVEDAVGTMRMMAGVIGRY